MVSKYHKLSAYEREKYVKLYSGDNYGSLTPMFKHGFSEYVFDFIGLEPQRIIDFGAGTGLPAEAFRRRGHAVVEVDFAPANPGVIEADITDEEHMKDIRGDVGICLDVMEHIPKRRCELALRNIAKAVPRCFFAIPMCLGGKGNRELHINIQQLPYWEEELIKFFELKEVRVHSLLKTPGGFTLLVNASART